MPPSPKAARHRDNRRPVRRAAALVPLALASGSCTTFLLASSTASSDAQGFQPDRVSPPAAPIQAPASLATLRRAAPGATATRNGVQPAASVRDQGIPAVALAAYQRAATVVDAADPTCHLGWPLLAAIGRVESDHGRHAGSLLSGDGLARPSIYGPILDGTHGTSRIADTDGGLFDRNRQVDRAVGPMQFIPSTWLAVAVDGDGDAQRNPQDINDAALAAAVYLCSGDADLATDQGADSAVYRYNHSTAYVDLVRQIAGEYSTAGYASQVSSAYPPVLPFLAYHPASSTAAHHRHAPHRPVGASGEQSGATSASTPSTSPEQQAAPAQPSKGPAPSRDGQRHDPVSQVVDSTQSTATSLLDQTQNQSQELLRVLLPMP